MLPDVERQPLLQVQHEVEVDSRRCVHPLAAVPIEECTSAFYLRIPSLDRPGAFARVATLLSEREISIESALQRAQAIHAESANAWVPIVIVTQPVPERVMNDALAAVQALPEVVGPVVRIRVEDFGNG